MFLWSMYAILIPVQGRAIILVLHDATELFD